MAMQIFKHILSNDSLANIKAMRMCGYRNAAWGFFFKDCEIHTHGGFAI